MRFDVLTLFPEMFSSVMSVSIIGNAVDSGIISVNTINIRDFSKDKHKRVDDYPYGGGLGMVMQPQPIYDAYVSAVKDIDYKPKTIYMTPQGKLFNQEIAKQLSAEKHLIILCGHYEGIDERVIEQIVDEEISVGDYVVTGGELPAMILIDAVSRLIPGVLSDESAYTGESLYNGLLEYPQYTRPAEFMGRLVPEVLLSGHHENIENWRNEMSLERTKFKRPDLYKKFFQSS